MQRIPEPELMLSMQQCQAYAEADFSAPHEQFISHFTECFPHLPTDARVLDLGCGAADITIRFALAFPGCSIAAVDGSATMLALAQERIQAQQLQARISLLHTSLQTLLPRQQYDVIISNSLLHHLHSPAVLWDSLWTMAHTGAPIFVMDLRRPASIMEATKLVEYYAGNAPDILQQDFYNSLCAAFTPDEVQQQLHIAGLNMLTIEAIADRHLIIHGQLPVKI